MGSIGFFASRNDGAVGFMTVAPGGWDSCGLVLNRAIEATGAPDRLVVCSESKTVCEPSTGPEPYRNPDLLLFALKLGIEPLVAKIVAIWPQNDGTALLDIICWASVNYTVLPPLFPRVVWLLCRFSADRSLALQQTHRQLLIAYCEGVCRCIFREKPTEERTDSSSDSSWSELDASLKSLLVWNSITNFAPNPDLRQLLKVWCQRRKEDTQVSKLFAEEEQLHVRMLEQAIRNKEKWAEPVLNWKKRQLTTLHAAGNAQQPTVRANPPPLLHKKRVEDIFALSSCRKWPDFPIQTWVRLAGHIKCHNPRAEFE